MRCCICSLRKIPNEDRARNFTGTLRAMRSEGAAYNLTIPPGDHAHIVCIQTLEKKLKRLRVKNGAPYAPRPPKRSYI